MNEHPSHHSGGASSRGNAIFLVLIAIVLFAVLTYALTRSMSGGASVTREKATLANGVNDQCVAYVEHGANMLQVLRGCSSTEISYELPNGTNPNPLAPADKHCHVFDSAGAGLSACGQWLVAQCSAAAMLALAVGEQCPGSSIVYAGTVGGKRIYTTTADQGTYTGNNGGWCFDPDWPHGTSDTDGKANTDAQVAWGGGCKPYAAATACRSLGAEWYLPAINELTVLRNAKSTGALAGTFTTTGGCPGISGYQSSTEENDMQVKGLFFDPCGWSWDMSKITPWRVRCVRSD
jgi:hypothetical protein